ncbi:MAG: methylphosphotriester-DNA--protein-cysteine methyltransferase family protein [Kordiimonadaceae bacterium]|nr:methylphosphotriester-DNA--protein-cysteine methyltransferase family protein [Kordiimonadaceae bacterium]MBO6567711.1 methylphosphotriester-DNA--protein-cysteine methyltransferase family protein [Kordiimonadaceae bacterium]MBO6963074.1 methylphosphotriester-DNA--protein-cysteine methyltransferase family protein [Kordiimonadaceae bacterium]
MNMTDPHTRHLLYEALLRRDERYDGKLFFAVTSTGIYCRPVCPAPKPKPQNVLYYADAQTAALAGFRACKRCRPESRPGSPAWQGTKATVSRALRLLADPEGPESLEALSDKLGVTDRHLRRLFHEHLGKSPMDIKQENRLSLATTLLADPNAAIADVAFASGFQSLRRFNDVFKKEYGVPPSKWRQQCN